MLMLSQHSLFLCSAGSSPHNGIIHIKVDLSISINLIKVTLDRFSNILFPWRFQNGQDDKQDQPHGVCKVSLPQQAETLFYGKTVIQPSTQLINHENITDYLVPTESMEEFLIMMETKPNIHWAISVLIFQETVKN